MLSLLALAPALAAAPALPPRLPNEPAVGGELYGELLHGEALHGEAAAVPLIEQRLEVDVGVTEALLTLTQRFEVPSDAELTYSFATPEAAWLLNVELRVDGAPWLVDGPTDGPLQLKLGRLPAGSEVEATLDLVLPIELTANNSRLVLPSAARLSAAAPWLEAPAPEQLVSLWFDREVYGLVIEEGRLDLDVDFDEDLILEWREGSGAFAGAFASATPDIGAGGGGMSGGASCFASYTRGEVLVRGCEGARTFGGVGGRGSGGSGGFGRPSSANDPGCDDPAAPASPQRSSIGLGDPGPLASLQRERAAAEVGYDDRLASAAGPGLLGADALGLGRDMPWGSPDDRALVDQRIRRELPGIQACYRRNLAQNPELAGTLTVLFLVKETGMAAELVVESSELSDPSAEECVLERLRFARFHEPEAPFYVRYPFRFTPPDDAAG